MPVVPIETPSETEIVLNSIGVPPAARMPSLTCFASTRWLRLHGIVSIQVVATPTSGFARSSSVKPTAFSIARAGARSTAVGQGGAAALGGIGGLRSRRSCMAWAPPAAMAKGQDIAHRRLAGAERARRRRAARRPFCGPDDDGRARARERDARGAATAVRAQLREQRRVGERGRARAGGRGRRRRAARRRPRRSPAPSSAACAAAARLRRAGATRAGAPRDAFVLTRAPGRPRSASSGSVGRDPARLRAARRRARSGRRRRGAQARGCRRGPRAAGRARAARRAAPRPRRRRRRRAPRRPSRPTSRARARAGCG